MTAIVPTKTKRTSAPKEPFYPVSDGEPMAETNLHWEVTVYAKEAVRERYQHRDDVYVASDNFLYYEKGIPSSVVSPDCYVVFGVSSELRDSYKTWEEGGRLPSVVIEITSKKTRKEDTGRKFVTYQDLRVAEYFLFDPTADYIRTRLTGYRLNGQSYVVIEPDASGRLYSQELGLTLAVEGNRLRYYDPADGKKLLTDLEARNLARQEAQRANEEAQANVELRAQLAEAQARMEALEKQIQEATSLRQNAQTENANNND